VRAVLGWILLISGISVAVVGLSDVGLAAWGQLRAEVAVETNAPAMPRGFTAELMIPRLGAKLFVVDAKASRDLRRGPGYIAGSTKPGTRGNCIIAGHRDLHFRMLKDIRVGDEIEIQTAQNHFTYRVSATQVVAATDRNALRPVFPEQLTLVTCFPFYYIGPAPKRFIVQAYRM